MVAQRLELQQGGLYGLSGARQTTHLDPLSVKFVAMF